MTLPADSWWHNRAELQEFAQTFDRSARLALKTSRVWNIGALRTFATTIGRTVYIPADWSSGQVMRVLPHEVDGHVKQFRYAGLCIHPNLGIFPGMFLVYVWGVLFPVLFAWGRYRCELHADTKSWQFHLRAKLWTPVEVKSRAEYFGKLVAGKPYIWAMPRRWVLWGFGRRANKVIREAASEG